MTDFVPLQNTLSGGPAGPNGPAPPWSQQVLPIANYPPAPQVSATQALTTQVSNGNITTQTQPANTNQGPGNQSVLAQLSTGQIVFNQSLYGQASQVPGCAGIISGQANQPGSTVATGAASGLTVATPPVYVGG
jgi:hypothetical protein